MDFFALWARLVNKKNWIGVLVVTLTGAGYGLYKLSGVLATKIESQYEERLSKADSTENDLREQIKILNQARLDDKEKSLDERDERIRELTEGLTGVKKKVVVAEEYVATNKKSDVRLKQKSQRNNTQSKVIYTELDKVQP